MVLLAAQLSRRIGRFPSGARSIERGDLSNRIDPDYSDELEELAGSFNAVAARLPTPSWGLRSGLRSAPRSLKPSVHACRRSCVRCPPE